VVYDEKTHKADRKIKRLKRGDYMGWESFQDQVKYVEGMGNGGTCHVDFDLILAKETAALTTRIAPPATPRVLIVTATILQEEGITGCLAVEQAGGGWAVAIQDKWQCQDTCCRNYRYNCWFPRVTGQKPRFKHHLAVNSVLIAAWACSIDNCRSTVNKPHNIIQLSITRAEDQTEAEKRSRGNPAGGGGGKVAELMKVVTLGLLKQISDGQQAQTTPVTSPVTTRSPPLLPEWMPFEYDRWLEIYKHTTNFFRWLSTQQIGLSLEKLEEVYCKVYRKERININMLLNCSNNGVPMVQWVEQFNQPTGVLLQLCKLAKEWQ
jgi:hypothetical protein